MLVSCVGQSLPHCGQPKRLPASKSSVNTAGWFAFKSTLLTFHPASSCKAAVNKGSGVIPPMLFPLAGTSKAGNEALVRYSTARRARLSQNKIICAYPFPTAAEPQGSHTFLIEAVKSNKEIAGQRELASSVKRILSQRT